MPLAPTSTASATPRGCTSFKLRQLTRCVASRYDAELAAAGLKTTQYSLLSHVQALGPVAPGELARAMTMDASTLTRNLKPLLAAGWVTLQPGPDGRSRRVELTAAGRVKRAEAQRRWRAAQEGLQAALGLARTAALHAMLDDALARLDPAASAASEAADAR